MEYRSFSAKTKEEAITAACMELGVTSDRLDFVVEQEAASGLFGLGRKDAVIRARIKEGNEMPVPPVKSEQAAEEPVAEKAATAAEETSAEGPKIKTLEEIEARAKAAAEKNGGTYEEVRTERRSGDRDGRRRGGRNRRGNGTREERPRDYTPSQPKPEKEVPVRTEEEIAQMKADAEQFLSDVFSKMGISVEKTIDYDPQTGYLGIEFSGDEMGILIGKRGQTLDSLQYLTSLVVNKNQKEYVRVKLDTEEYRKRRKETLESLSRNIAGKVKRTHRSVVLEPMNPYERRIIHSALQGNHYVETYSEGDEPYRRVVVTPKKDQ